MTVVKVVSVLYKLASSDHEKTYFLARPSRLPPSPTVMCMIPQGSTLLANTRVCFTNPQSTSVKLINADYALINKPQELD